MGYGRGDRIAVVLPNGPELALAIVSIMNHASCVPLNASGAQSELESDLKACHADLIIGPVDDEISVTSSSHGHVGDIAKRLKIPFCGLLASETDVGLFRLINLPSTTEVEARKKTKKNSPKSVARDVLVMDADSGAGSPGRFNFPETTANTAKLTDPNNHQDEVLVLFTSGTTGSKKLVPHILGDMLVASATIALSWDLTPKDVNCNLMPLFHVGGIVRQIFSPIVSGGCVICCPSFDPVTFWNLCRENKFSWYYAAPTMHQLILQTYKEMNYTNFTPKLRMIANAAGGLLPSLARELRETFGGANVLPSYGMTECMPISSPPSNYQLERPGTSGVAVGPEIAILNIVNGNPLPPMTEGPICVKGYPCFRGYGHNFLNAEQSGNKLMSSFVNNGEWFNTGDLGYLDADGYLFITGRSKEVINRGGEIISPLEVEEAIVSHPEVKAALCFSAEHDVLQEVVGVVIVPVEDNAPRLNLQVLHDYLVQENLLAQPKWPQCLVFMNALPKSHTNKLLRVKLGQRMKIPELNDSMSPVQRTFEATCPPQGTGTMLPIPSWPVSVDAKSVQDRLTAALKTSSSSSQGEVPVLVTDHAIKKGSLVCYLRNVDRIEAFHTAEKLLHAYEVPSHFVSLPPIGAKLPSPRPNDSVQAIKQQIQYGSETTLISDELETEIQQLFADMLNLDCHPHPDSSFFNLGGNSMLASKLAAKLRKIHVVALNGTEIFQHSTCKSLAKVIRERRSDASKNNGATRENHEGSKGFKMGATTSSWQTSTKNFENCDFSQKRMLPESSSGCCLKVFQAMPLFLVLPVYQLSRFVLFFTTLHYTNGTSSWYHLLFAGATFYMISHTIFPLIFVIIKWTVIGRYQRGRYPVYGSYYLRWWFVEVCRNMLGTGLWGYSPTALAIYYRFLGAKIGSNVRINWRCVIAEYDLVTIEDNAALEDCLCRAFCVENGSFLLGLVSVGRNASVGIKSVVAPNTCVPENMHLGAQSTSYDMDAMSSDHALHNRMLYPEPNLVVKAFGDLLVLIVNLIGHLPTYFVFYCLIHSSERGEFETVGNTIEWLCNPYRIPYYFGMKLARHWFDPIAYMLTAILIKWTFIGRFEPGPRETSQYQLLRYYLATNLYSSENIQSVADIFGRHYELVSMLYRLLGAKIGERVFWPGTALIFTGEFDLLEIGDDVVFGSRSAIFCGARNRLEKVRLCAGSNLSDNTVIMPGSTAGKNAVLGSYGICPADWYLPESSLWFGARGCEPVLLEKGVRSIEENKVAMALLSDTEKYPMGGDESTLRPFGKAFYLGEASYWVMPLSVVILTSAAISMFITILHASHFIVAVHGAATLLYGINIAERDFNGAEYSLGTVFVTLFGCLTLTSALRIFVAFAIEINAKWALIGQRQEGVYNWDKSSYAQRWEIYQMVQKIRDVDSCNMINFLNGTPYLITFFRLMGCKIGQDCCLYPTGGNPYPTELDLVTIGDRNVIDSGRIVCHLNTRGNLELYPIVLEEDVTLRGQCKVQMGVRLERGSMLLENSLALTGEVVEADSVWQGVPAIPVFNSQQSYL